MVGYGLEFSEMDIWWLISRKREFEKQFPGEFGRVILYVPNMNEEKKYSLKALAEAYRVEINTKKLKSRSNANHLDYYNKLPKKIIKSINK